ncbi:MULTISPECIES: hypothetical protein [Chryseobacterium]|uniref:Uncharacterized protein n=1 Tax=Chryseobacterium camelliae TaxID=1265445 RepID=A0ABU0TKU9_9FLAO|nr:MULTISPECIES: hypothetical protein [Chryseobacterium]MDT3408471.1 hypothetical protein [Pseudacidovorax intermedius]MDQ1097673.1 hypothetical protein [Chryseobacterium camelliae]MDQ1101602.1 hypothetical protein [Chryseobacterium sp. SORGH_AS_1048]MDR6085045.1 hypothetical protein [Chryseobacterium sp. SORGH_AS_0909]MDR6129400.1 hypothetical protein [Chryseobacterium sp. SORGH_AS_1175]
MNLRYIAIGLDYNTYIERDNKLRYQFQLNTRFISNYLSKEVRKIKFQTDGTFNMITIALTEDKLKETDIVPIDVLQTYLPFDRNKYEKIRGTDDCQYYIELFQKGFVKASKFKKLPLESLLEILRNFEDGGCKNEWLHKTKKFKEQNLEIKLVCDFNTNFFQLTAIINQLSDKKEIFNKAIIKTEPDEVLFDKMFKDIKIANGDIIITDKSDSPRIKISIDDLYSNNCKAEIIGNKEIKRILSYKLS